MGLHVGGTQYIQLSATNVQTRCSGSMPVPCSIVQVHLGRASVTPMARMPCCIVPGELADGVRPASPMEGKSATACWLG